MQKITKSQWDSDGDDFVLFYGILTMVDNSIPNTYILDIYVNISYIVPSIAMYH